MKSDFLTNHADLLALLPTPLKHPSVIRAIQSALAEDLEKDGDWDKLEPSPTVGDISSQSTLPANCTINGYITSKATGVVAGLPVVQAVFYLVDHSLQVEKKVEEGQHVQFGTVLCKVSGRGTSLLTAERTALNFLGRMSGIATLTERFVSAVQGTRAVILDTRKTAPGLRYLDKYAVRMGGGQNHRIGLFDMIMIKDNHIDGAGGIEEAVRNARQLYGDQYAIEVEVSNLDELQTALNLKVDRIMLDNMDLETMRQAVVITQGRTELEASGNVSLATVRSIAETGVDYISSGSLTHSAPVLDISLRLR